MTEKPSPKARKKPSERLDLDRRVPTQARSQQRVERILDAAAEVFADVGFEAATTEGIAARAETSIGSLYQFFPNKRALLYAIAQRYAERVNTLFDEVEAGVLVGEAPFGTLLRAAIVTLVDFHDREPGFRALVRNWTAEFAAYDEAANAEFTRRTAEILGKRAPGLPKGRRIVVAHVLVETVSAMLISASRRSRRGPQIVEETTVMLERWLAPYANDATLHG